MSKFSSIHISSEQDTPKQQTINLLHDSDKYYMCSGIITELVLMNGVGLYILTKWMPLHGLCNEWVEEINLVLDWQCVRLQLQVEQKNQEKMV